MARINARVEQEYLDKLEVLKNQQQSSITQVLKLAIDEYYASRCAELMDKYQDLPMDLTDASLVVLAEDLGSGAILSTDRRDFNAYGGKNAHPFQNLLLID